MVFRVSIEPELMSFDFHVQVSADGCNMFGWVPFLATWGDLPYLRSDGAM